MTNKCLVCKKPTKEYRNKYCSHKCASQMRAHNSVKLPCQHCGMLVHVINARKPTFKFCSRRCMALSQCTKQTAKCKICGKKFIHISSRANKAKYCSRTCYYKARVGSVKMKCAMCNNIVIRSPKHVLQVKHPCCSIKCRGLLFRKTHPANATTARRFKKCRGELKHCERCGYKKYPEILVVHHKDRNKKNNRKHNLEVLCPNCHAIEHYATIN